MRGKDRKTKEMFNCTGGFTSTSLRFIFTTK